MAGTITPVPLPMVEEEKAVPIVPVVIEEAPCALDGAPVNSKIVVVTMNGERTAVFATPQGLQPLDAKDVAHGLPRGAKISKDAEGSFRAEQLDEPTRHAPLIATTAREAIRRFLAHFHTA